MAEDTPYQEEFKRWHDANKDECPVCNPHVCDDYCNDCEGS